MHVRFVNAAALVHEMIEAADERRLQRLQKQLAAQDLLIVDEFGLVPLSMTGVELLFEVVSQRYERGSVIVTSNLPLDEWTEVFGTERLTGAILDRLGHHIHILEMNGDTYRLRQSPKSQVQSLNKPAFGRCALARVSYVRSTRVKTRLSKPAVISRLQHSERT